MLTIFVKVLVYAQSTKDLLNSAKLIEAVIVNIKISLLSYLNIEIWVLIVSSKVYLHVTLCFVNYFFM